MRKLSAFAVTSTCSLLAIAGCAAEGGSSSEFYAGKTIEIIVPFGPGGGGDTIARFYAPFLREHIPGNPNIQIVNKEGGGSITGSNEFFQKTDPDGLTLLQTGGGTNMGHLLRLPAVKFDYGEMTPVAGFPSGVAAFVSPSTGVESAEELTDPPEPLIYGGVSPVSTDVVPLLSFEMLGVPVSKHVFGYEGSGPALLAFEQGEVNLNAQTTSTYLTSVEPLIENGQATPLYTFGTLDADGNVVPDPVFEAVDSTSDLPSIEELYVSVHGEDPTGPAWEAYKAALASSYTVNKTVWLQQDAPEEAVNIIRAAFEDMANDPEFIEASEEITGGYEPLVGDEVAGPVSILQDVDPETLDWLDGWLEDEFQVDLADVELE